jgi:hypothetical protein
MAWTTSLVTIVRHLINDLDSSAYVYSNDRVKQSIVIAAQLCSFEVSFDKTYTINIDAVTITPDPFDETQDNGFINLIALRSALLIYSNEAKIASKLGIRITDGPSTIDVSGRLSSALRLLDSAAKSYEKAKVDYVVGNARGFQAVTTPYTVPFISGGDGLE